MNKIIKTFIAILGGLNIFFSIATPILVAILWSKVIGLQDWRSILLFVIGALASLFRGIKTGIRI